MPNTLAHIGIQSLLTRAVLRDVDLKWVYLGCVIPDIPWILQRVIFYVNPGASPDPLRFYLDVQASFIGCLVLSAALAFLSRQSRRKFLILGINALLHLALDASQTKWANGVHFVAPFSWELTNWGFFWPESLPTYILTAIGLLFILFYWKRSTQIRSEFRRPTGRRLAGFSAFLLVYFTLPLLFLQGPELADNHFMVTLRSPQSRTGRYAEFDRANCRPAEGYMQCFNSTEIRVTGVFLEKPSTLSLRGTFISENEFRVSESHIHNRAFRNGASYLGLTMIALFWITALFRPFLVPRPEA